MNIAITIILLTVLTFGPIGVLTSVGAARARRGDDDMPGLDMTGEWPPATWRRP